MKQEALRGDVTLKLLAFTGTVVMVHLCLMHSQLIYMMDKLSLVVISDISLGSTQCSGGKKRSIMDIMKKYWNAQTRWYIVASLLFERPSRRGPWRPGSSRRELMNLIPPSGKLSSDVPWTKAENSTWSTMAPKRSPWILWRSMMCAKSHSPWVTKVNMSWLTFFVLFKSLDIFLHFTFVFLISTFVKLSFTPQGPQTLVPGLRMMKRGLRKMFQIHQSLSLHTHPMVNNLSSYIVHIYLPPCSIKPRHTFWSLLLTSSLCLLLMKAPAPLLSSCGLPWAQSPPCSPPVAPLQTKAGPKRSLLKSGLKRSLWTWRCNPHPWVTCPLLLYLITQCSCLFYLKPCLPPQRRGSAPSRVSVQLLCWCCKKQKSNDHPRWREKHQLFPSFPDCRR